MNLDFSDMLKALNAAEVEYLVVGAYAISAHGHDRATGDIDFWVRPTLENAHRVWAALEAFGAPRSRLAVEDFCSPELFYQIGVAPLRIDFLTSISGTTFEEAWPNRKLVDVDGIAMNVIGRKELAASKRAAGRPKDLADLAWLEANPPENEK